MTSLCGWEYPFSKEIWTDWDKISSTTPADSNGSQRGSLGFEGHTNAFGTINYIANNSVDPSLLQAQYSDEIPGILYENPFMHLQPIPRQMTLGGESTSLEHGLAQHSHKGGSDQISFSLSGSRTQLPAQQRQHPAIQHVNPNDSLSNWPFTPESIISQEAYSTEGPVNPTSIPSDDSREGSANTAADLKAEEQILKELLSDEKLKGEDRQRSITPHDPREGSARTAAELRAEARMLKMLIEDADRRGIEAKKGKVQMMSDKAGVKKQRRRKS
jgi:hypothetical protein